jgi:hypothetical protein
LKSAPRITLIYVLFASCWIVLSDRIISRFTDNIGILTTYASIKGLFFVTVTSVLLFVLIRRDSAARSAVIVRQERLLRVKEDLIRELHHRVWNNIQVVIGVLGLETGDVDFSARTKERIVKRLLSMRSVYDVVYNYEDMGNLSLGNVLSAYESARSRNIRVAPTPTTELLPVETLVSVLLVLDVMLESIQEAGYGEKVEVSAAGAGALELRLAVRVADLPALLGANESFVRAYLISLSGDVKMVPGNPSVIRITYR